jgi:hypothetical protein
MPSGWGIGQTTRAFGSLAQKRAILETEFFYFRVVQTRFGPRATKKT